jgi:cystathionine beta-lyase/cystathionine gamma-synthase
MNSFVIRNNKYARNHYDSLDLLSTTVGNLYGVPSNCLITTSGMQAIYLSILTVCIQNKWKRLNLIYASELYSDTPKLFNYFSQTFGNLTLIQSDPNDMINTFKNYQNNDNILFVETCSNPNGIMFNFTQIKELRRISKSLVVITDNTWLTNFIMNPLELGADVVVTSLTKYYSAGSAIAGAILFANQKMFHVARSNSTAMGNHISPATTQVINREIMTTRARLVDASTKTIKILDRLKLNNKILKINHPYINNIDLPIYPSVFTIESYCTKSKALSTLKYTKIKHETSFGSAYSKTDPWPTEKQIDDIPITTWRISIGYEDDENVVCDELENIISKLHSFKMS